MTDQVTFRDCLRLAFAETREASGVKIKVLIPLYRLSAFGMLRGGWVRWSVLPVTIIYRLYSELLVGIELPPRIWAGAGLRVYHGYGTVIHPAARIGARCTLRHGVTIGNKIMRDGLLSAAPSIGDDVEFGVGAVVIGPVCIGNNAKIGAGAVVTKSVAPRAVIVGGGCREL